jgi:hypothetical protein
MDAVITWVEGNDPVHTKMRLAAMDASEQWIDPTSNAVVGMRFNDRGEIYFAIASILKFAPFIQRIFIVTDRQKPKHLSAFVESGICGADRIRVVDHKEIFHGFEKFLPTFSSLSIESLLWRIEDLSQEFLYFNDDFFLNAAVRRDDFFDEKNRMRVPGKRRSTKQLRIKLVLRRLRYRLLGKGQLPAHYKTAQALSADLSGLDYYVQLDHHPHPQRKASLERFFAVNPDILHKQISPKFRTIDQFLPVGLCNHLELKNETAVREPPRDVVYIKPSNYSEAQIDALRATDVKFGCIQSLDEFQEEQVLKIRQTMASKLEGYLPLPVLGHLGLATGAG